MLVVCVFLGRGFNGGFLCCVRWLVLVCLYVLGLGFWFYWGGVVFDGMCVVEVFLGFFVVS